MSRSKIEEEVIRNVITRLQGKHRQQTTDHISKILADENFRIWCNSYVVAPLVCLLPEKRNLKLAKGLSK